MTATRKVGGRLAEYVLHNPLTRLLITFSWTQKTLNGTCGRSGANVLEVVEVLGSRWGLEHWSWEPEGEPLLKQLTQDCERHGQPGSCSASTHRVTHRCSDLVGQCWLQLQWEWLTVLPLRELRRRVLRLRTLTCKLLTSRSCRPMPLRRPPA